MTSKERKLASILLKEASEEFGNHGCNDVEESIWKGWTLKERQKFVKEYYEKDGHPEDYDPNDLHIPDYALMSFLADKLKQ